MSSQRPGRPKSQAKQDAILKAASTLFLENGVISTSMEEIAKQSGVSKQTVYSHFNNKDALYTAVIEKKCNEYKIKPHDLQTKADSLETALLVIAEKFIALFHDDEVIAMYTIIFAEARNTPKVAELFYAAGPMDSMNAVRKIIASYTQETLSAEKVHLLSLDFFNLLRGEYHMRSLMNMNFRLNEKQQKQFAIDLVDKTLCLYSNYYQ